MCGVFEKLILAMVVDGKLCQRPIPKSERTETLENLIVLIGENYGTNPSWHLSVELEPARVFPENFDIKLLRDSAENSNFTIEGCEFPAAIFFGPETRAELGFKNIEQWLHQYVTHHECGTTSFCQLPTRLLDLHGDQVRVIETKGVESPYVCLSYRWGGYKEKRLLSTSKTLHTHLKAILWDELPKTFQNAVIICRRLKIYYLWIDALCILQECPGLTAAQVTETKKDFARENTAMANIYQNSYFTISADISTSMNSGIFSFSSNKYHAIQVVDDNSNNVTLYGQSTDLEHGRKPTTLEERGWTFQESSLPHRVLCYGEFDITWRCQQLNSCECGYSNHTNAILDNINHSREAFSRRTRVTSQNLEKFLAWWSRIVYYYMPRDLTNENDKLPALSGLAQIYHRKTGDSYLAGLWRNSILHDLCWYNCHNFNLRIDRFYGPYRGHRSTQYRAPS